MVTVFIFAVSNHHSGTYDSRQAQRPGTMPRETWAPLPVVPTWSQTQAYTLSHTHTYIHIHARINTSILQAAGDVSPQATGIDVFWHIGWSSVNYAGATLAPSASKMNEPAYMPGYNSSEAGV